jgi:hypothetical protein
MDGLSQQTKKLKKKWMTHLVVAAQATRLS